VEPDRLIIDRALNLVQSFDTNIGTVHVHSMPISHEVWRNYFLILSKTYNQTFEQGLGINVGPSVASMLLERIAKLDHVWEGDDGVERGLMAEIRRLTNVIIPTAKGWETIPYESARDRILFDAESIDDMEGTIVFFISASAVLRGSRMKQRRMTVLGFLEALPGVLTTSLDCTGYLASLPISMPVENTGAMVPVSSLPH
jgi:hypothetical protein